MHYVEFEEMSSFNIRRPFNRILKLDAYISQVLEIDTVLVEFQELMTFACRIWGEVTLWGQSMSFLSACFINLFHALWIMEALIEELLTGVFCKIFRVFSIIDVLQNENERYCWVRGKEVLQAPSCFKIRLNGCRFTKLDNSSNSTWRIYICGVYIYIYMLRRTLYIYIYIYI